MNKSKNLSHIVIIGGGAGGLELATRSGKTLGKSHKAEITLVDCSPTHLWKPLLHEVAAGTLNSFEDELNYMVHAYLYHFHFVLGQFINLNRKQREITLAPITDTAQSEIIPPRTIKYDTLVIAIGGMSNTFSTPGAKEYCLFLDKIAQAKNFQQQFLKDILRTQNMGKKFSVAIVGAGATGIELVAELHYAMNQAMRYSAQTNTIEFTVIESSNRVLPALPERLSIAITKQLEKIGVKIFTGHRVTHVTEDAFILDDDTTITSDLKVWTAGVKAPDFLKHLDGLATNKINQILVKQNLQTIDDENIFALGDCASCPQADKNSTVPPRAQAAHQQATALAKSLRNRLENKPLIDFYYHDYGSLITLSRYETTGNLMGRLFNVFIEGKLARMFYVSLYKMHQTALYGYWRTFLLTFANGLTRRIRPRLKLH